MKSDARHSILIVEDNDEDFELITWALKKLSIAIPVFRCIDGDDALDYLHGRGAYTDPQQAPRPTIVLLDLNLKMMNGQEILEQIKNDDDLKAIPVIVWTASTDPEDVEICFKHGANSYILKPMNLEKLLQAVELLNEYWFGVVVLPENIEM